MTMMKETEEDTKNGKIFGAHGLKELVSLKCPYYPKQPQIQHNPYQNSNGIFHRTRTNKSKMCMESQKILNSQSTREKEEQSWRHHTL